MRHLEKVCAVIQNLSAKRTEFYSLFVAEIGKRSQADVDKCKSLYDNIQHLNSHIANNIEKIFNEISRVLLTELAHIAQHDANNHAVASELDAKARLLQAQLKRIHTLVTQENQELITYHAVLEQMLHQRRVSQKNKFVGFQPPT